MTRCGYVVCAAVVALGLSASPSWASRPIPTVDGTITAVSGDQVVIGSRTYDVAINSPALHELANIHAGDKVEAVLSGPPGAPTTRVIEIHVHQ